MTSSINPKNPSNLQGINQSIKQSHINLKRIADQTNKANKVSFENQLKNLGKSNINLNKLSSVRLGGNMFNSHNKISKMSSKLDSMSKNINQNKLDNKVGDKVGDKVSSGTIFAKLLICKVLIKNLFDKTGIARDLFSEKITKHLWKKGV